MSVISSLGVKEEEKKILDCGGFLRDVEEHLKLKFPHILNVESREEAFVDIVKLTVSEDFLQKSWTKLKRKML